MGSSIRFNIFRAVGLCFVLVTPCTLVIYVLDAYTLSFATVEESGHL